MISFCVMRSWKLLKRTWAVASDKGDDDGGGDGDADGDGDGDLAGSTTTARKQQQQQQQHGACVWEEFDNFNSNLSVLIWVA